MSNQISLRFVWNGEEGDVDRCSLDNLMKEDGIVVLDFLSDIIFEAQSLYNLAVESGILWNAQGMPSEGPRREGGSGASAPASPVAEGDASKPSHPGTSGVI